MSSTGVRESNDTNKRVIKGLILNEAQFIQSLRVFANTSTLSGLGSTEGEINNSPIEASGNYLSRLGDTMLGPLALAPPLDFRIEIDANNTIDIGPLNDNSQYTSNVQLDSIQPNSFVLDIIANAAFDGQLLVLRTFAPGTPFTISQGTLGNGGNIQTGDGSDLTVGDLQTVTLIFDAALIIEANTGGSWRVISVSSGGGAGSLSEPIELGFNEVVTQTPPTLTIIAGDIFNPSHVNLDQDIELQLDISATTTKYKSIFVIFDTTGGGFTVTWPASVVNPPTISDSIAQRISVILYTIDNGTLWTHATSVGSSSGAEFFGPWTANHDAGINSLVNLAAVAIVDAGGLPRGSISGDAGATAVRLSLATANKFIISDVLTDIVSFDDTTGLTIEGTHVINMGNNIINTISELQLSNANLHTPSNELSIAFDSGVGALRYSVPLTTNAHQFFADTDLLASITRVGVNEGQLSIHAVVANILQADDQLFFTDSSTDPTTNGQFRRNGADVKVFTGGSLVNLSDVGSPQSSIVDGNTSATVLDAAPSFVVVLNGVQKYSISNTRVDYVELDLFGINQINMTDPAANPISSLTASASGLLLNILSTSDFYDIKFNSVDAFHVDELRTRILSTSPNLTSAKLSLFRDDPTPTNGDDLGAIQFDGRNSAAEFITYAVLAGGITSITDGSESGVIVVNMFDNGFIVQQLRLEDGALRIRKFSSVASDVATLDLEKEDTTPIANDSVAEINFNINDSGVITTYASISTTIVNATDNAALTFSVRADNGLISAMVIQGDDNNQRFQTLMSGTSQARIQPIFDRMGYFVTPQVTDFTLVLGTNGSLQIPQFSDGSPSLTDLNQAGGAFDGAIVHDTFDGDLYIRANSARWDRYARTGTVV